METHPELSSLIEAVGRRPAILFASTNTTTAPEFFRSATDLGFEPVLVHADPDRLPFDAPRCTLRAVPTKACVVATVEALEQAGGQVAGVHSTSDETLLVAALAATELGLPGPDPAGIAACRDKFCQRVSLLKSSVVQPRFAWANDVSAALVAARRVGYPCIVKPRTGTGSVGVRLARQDSDVVASMVADEGLPSPVMIEQYVTGPEYSVEIWRGRALGVTAKTLGAPPAFVEIGHAFPAPGLSPHAFAALASAAECACDVLKVGEFGAAHVELRLVDGVATLIEVNPRLAGGQIPTLIRLATGVDLVGQTLKATVGYATLRLDTVARCGAAIRFVVPDGAGIVINASGIADARAMPGVTDLRFYREAGFRFNPHHDFRDRIGHVIAVADSASEASCRAEAALVRVGSVLAPEPGGNT